MHKLAPIQPTAVMRRAGWLCMPMDFKPSSDMDYVYYIYAAMLKVAPHIDGIDQIPGASGSAYQLVPVEPTERMCEAGEECMPYDYDGIVDPAQVVRFVYLAMTNAVGALSKDQMESAASPERPGEWGQTEITSDECLNSTTIDVATIVRNSSQAYAGQLIADALKKDAEIELYKKAMQRLTPPGITEEEVEEARQQILDARERLGIR